MSKNKILEGYAKDLAKCAGGTIFLYNGFGLNPIANPNDEDYDLEVTKYMNATKYANYTYHNVTDRIGAYNEYDIKEKIVDERGNIIIVVEL